MSTTLYVPQTAPIQTVTSLLFKQQVRQMVAVWRQLLYRSAAMVVREQTLVTVTVDEIRRQLPFPLLGLDVDNDSAFINETLVGYCKQQGIELTRSRAYKKNDQAWIEQKNGAVVRRLVGYGRLEGVKAAEILTKLHESARLYVNFFLPSFKLQTKTRVGAKFTRKYDKPATPYARLISSERVPGPQKQQLVRIPGHVNKSSGGDVNTDSRVM